VVHKEIVVGLAKVVISPTPIIGKHAMQKHENVPFKSGDAMSPIDIDGEVNPIQIASIGVGSDTMGGIFNIMADTSTIVIDMKKKAEGGADVVAVDNNK
jgi:hypothetical protein